MKRSIASLLAASAVFFLSAGAYADDKALSKEDVEAIVKKVIQDNPEFIMKSLQSYQEKEAIERVSKAAQNLSHMQDKIAHDPKAPFVGNPNGDVTVVEFFDYHCGYCKRFYPELAKLLHDDKNVKVVFKEFPILSPDSTDAAKAALAVWNVDKSKYFDYHIRLMQASGDFSEEVLTRLASDTGIDAEAFKKAYADPELKKELDKNKVLAKDLDIGGTPAIIIGTEFMPGAVSYDKLIEKVNEVRDIQNQKGGKKKEG